MSAADRPATIAPARKAPRSRRSPAQIRASRLNALKSTGPRTSEGKARSRQNALKHGLAGAGIVAHPDDETPLRDRLADWTADLDPSGSVEGWLVGRAALASVRLDRAARLDAAAIAERRERALSSWEYQRNKQVEAAVARLSRDPAGSVENLQATAAGCDWLLARWQELAQLPLDDPSGLDTWTDSALSLLGLPAFPTQDAPDPVSALGLCLLAARPEPDLEAVDRYFGTLTRRLEPASRLAEARRRLPAADSARDCLRSVLNAEVAHLTTRRATLWAEIDGPARHRIEELALADLSPAGSLLRRYESAQSLELHRSLRQLASMRRESPPEAELPDRPSLLRRRACRPVSVRLARESRSPVSSTHTEMQVDRQSDAPLSAVAPPPQPSPARGESVRNGFQTRESGSLPPCGGGPGWGVRPTRKFPRRPSTRLPLPSLPSTSRKLRRSPNALLRSMADRLRDRVQKRDEAGNITTACRETTSVPILRRETLIVVRSGRPDPAHPDVAHNPLAWLPVSG